MALENVIKGYNLNILIAPKNVFYDKNIFVINF